MVLGMPDHKHSCESKLQDSHHTAKRGCFLAAASAGEVTKEGCNLGVRCILTDKLPRQGDMLEIAWPLQQRACVPGRRRHDSPDLEDQKSKDPETDSQQVQGGFNPSTNSCLLLC